MTTYILVRYIHFISIITMIACLFLEFFLLKKENSSKELKKIWMIDGVYGMSSITTLAAGFTLWFWVGKPAAFYNENYLIWGKVFLFLIVGILSIWPTVYFFKNRLKNEDEDRIVNIPNHLKKVILLEIILLFIIPMLAVFMAQGFGQW